MTIRAFEGFEPALEHIFDLHIDLEAPQIVGQTPTGIRQIYVVKGGTADGPRLKADVLPGGGDWGIMRPDNFIQLDVRATMRADDGALIYSYYGGITGDVLKVAGRIFSGEDVPLSEYYSYITPQFQTSAPQHAWLNQVVGVGRGRIVPGGIEYRVWALMNA
jgi:uncharacterized protein DUF3237